MYINFSLSVAPKKESDSNKSADLTDQDMSPFLDVTSLGSNSFIAQIELNLSHLVEICSH